MLIFCLKISRIILSECPQQTHAGRAGQLPLLFLKSSSGEADLDVASEVEAEVEGSAEEDDDVEDEDDKEGASASASAASIARSKYSVAVTVWVVVDVADVADFLDADDLVIPAMTVAAGGGG